MNDFPTADQIESATRRLQETPLDRYLWLQDAFQNDNLVVGGTFTTRFAAFYGLRRSKKSESGQSWQAVYFEYLKSLRDQKARPSFAEALAWLSDRLPPLKKGGARPIEASFTSKMLATLDPDRPVLDSEILAHLKLQLPAYHHDRERRLADTIRVFSDMEGRLKAVVRSVEWKAAREEFDAAFPGRNTRARVTDMKALDLIVWASRGGIETATLGDK